jgi:hypothetical protein
LLLLSRKYITSLPLKDCVQKLNAHSNGWRTVRDEFGLCLSNNLSAWQLMR